MRFEDYDSFYAIEAFVSENPSLDWDALFLSRSKWVSRRFMHDNAWLDWDFGMASRHKQLTLDDVRRDPWLESTTTDEFATRYGKNIEPIPEMLGDPASRGYTCNPCFTSEDMARNPDIPWDQELIPGNPNSDIETIRKHIADGLTPRKIRAILSNPSVKCSVLLDEMDFDGMNFHHHGDFTYFIRHEFVLGVLRSKTLDIATLRRVVRRFPNIYIIYYDNGYNLYKVPAIITSPLITSKSLVDEAADQDWVKCVNWAKLAEREDFTIDVAEDALRKNLIKIDTFLTKVPLDPDFVETRINEAPPHLAGIYFKEMRELIKLNHARRTRDQMTIRRVIRSPGPVTYESMSRAMVYAHDQEVRKWIFAQDMAWQTRENFYNFVRSLGADFYAAKTVVQFMNIPGEDLKGT